MIQHDMKHEERQNKAIRHLVGIVSALAAECGKTGQKAMLAEVEKILTEDEEVVPTEAPAEVPIEAPVGDSKVEESKPEETKDAS